MTWMRRLLGEWWVFTIWLRNGNVVEPHKMERINVWMKKAEKNQCIFALDSPNLIIVHDRDGSSWMHFFVRRG